jgi:hypothetical protein
VLYYCGSVWGLFGWSSGSQLEARETGEALDVSRFAVSKHKFTLDEVGDCY